MRSCRKRGYECGVKYFGKGRMGPHCLCHSRKQACRVSGPGCGHNRRILVLTRAGSTSKIGSTNPDFRHACDAEPKQPSPKRASAKKSRTQCSRRSCVAVLRSVCLTSQIIVPFWMTMRYRVRRRRSPSPAMSSSRINRFSIQAQA